MILYSIICNQDYKISVITCYVKYIDVRVIIYFYRCPFEAN